MTEISDTRTTFEQALGVDQPALRQLSPARLADLLMLVHGAPQRDRAAADTELRERLQRMPWGARIVVRVALLGRRR
ncbi:hypothetical protein APR11_000558 [Nocardia amikacinitolerans]|uniref:hypothetical protein n=1 Tax=Nocardia amikacinitolerans TaxID=756689 RepID=UPI0020A2A68A|nr:hypothetical protein [Nocardia amikacinitolerans]MCP2294154.1 hypothetical protein [Nocardia amikacinitolerans]